MVQEKLMASANWASQKLLEQSRAYQAKTEPNQNPTKISPEMVGRVKLARRYVGSTVVSKVSPLADHHAFC